MHLDLPPMQRGSPRDALRIAMLQLQGLMKNAMNEVFESLPRLVKTAMLNEVFEQLPSHLLSHRLCWRMCLLHSWP
jgi:hypothetical protein